MSSSTSYQAPSFTDFKPSFSCPHCSQLNQQQDIRKTNEGRIYRICGHCNKTIDLHEPPKLIELEHKQAYKCYACACTNYKPVRGIECECGHLGSYHASTRVCTKSEMAPPRTRKSELIGRYDASQHADYDNSYCLVM